MMPFKTAHPSIRPASPVHRSDHARLRLTIRGAVQGVGFRPFLYRLARESNLTGFVRNTAGGVHLEVEGRRSDLDEFYARIELEKPSLSHLQSIEPAYLDPVGYEDFSIVESVGGEKRALILPDIATCPNCIAEIFDPKNRRYRYPFTNCTHCGPRYSILENLPYDRANTSMAKFVMCPECGREYENPEDRRFHAQPNACPECGPHLELWDHNGHVLYAQDEALRRAEESIRQGKIIALKGLGGFQLIVNAAEASAVARLRKRKYRQEKPFAVMVPNFEAARSLCEISSIEERSLKSPEAPIVLLKRRSDPLPSGSAAIRQPCEGVAPGNPWLGIFLPYTPLHHILLNDLGFPVVTTSANRTDEPMCIDNQEALEKLQGTADLFLVHDRPILRQVDDSIVREMGGRESILRRARGYAPLPFSLQRESPPCLAVGALLKNTIAASLGNEVYVSQHIGDLETEEAFGAFLRTTKTFRRLKDFEPKVVACDLHPDYLSTRYAESTSLPRIAVQHHYAHVLSCMAENEIEGPVLGVSWDGTGLGTDGTIWGGEFLLVDEHSFSRFAHLRTFPLPGGDKSSRQPRRAALGMLFEIEGPSLFDKGHQLLESFAEQERILLKTVLEKGIYAPRTSSVGRLFDGVCALLGLRSVSSFEGQAAMELEFATQGALTSEFFDIYLKRAYPNSDGDSWILDWESVVCEMMAEREQGLPVNFLSAKFHNTLCEMIVSIAHRANEEKVVLTGGCFQNKYLTERTIGRLREEGFKPYWHQRIPPNDGGIALGQIVAASREWKES